MEISCKQEHSLRRTLSKELHVGTRHDFDEARCFVRFVYLIGNNYRKHLAYMRDFLTASTLPVMISDDRFCKHDMAIYVLQIEQHTGFYPIALLKRDFELVCHSSGYGTVTRLASNAKTDSQSDKD